MTKQQIIIPDDLANLRGAIMPHDALTETEAAHEVCSWISGVCGADGEVGIQDIVAQIMKRWPQASQEIRSNIFGKVMKTTADWPVGGM